MSESRRREFLPPRDPERQVAIEHLAIAIEFFLDEKKSKTIAELVRLTKLTEEQARNVVESLEKMGIIVRNEQGEIIQVKNQNDIAQSLKQSAPEVLQHQLLKKYGFVAESETRNGDKEDTEKQKKLFQRLKSLAQVLQTFSKNPADSQQQDYSELDRVFFPKGNTKFHSIEVGNTNVVVSYIRNNTSVSQGSPEEVHRMVFSKDTPAEYLERFTDLMKRLIDKLPNGSVRQAPDEDVRPPSTDSLESEQTETEKKKNILKEIFDLVTELKDKRADVVATSGGEINEVVLKIRDCKFSQDGEHIMIHLISQAQGAKDISSDLYIHISDTFEKLQEIKQSFSLDLQEHEQRASDSSVTEGSTETDTAVTDTEETGAETLDDESEEIEIAELVGLTNEQLSTLHTELTALYKDLLQKQKELKKEEARLGSFFGRLFGKKGNEKKDQIEQELNNLKKEYETKRAEYVAHVAEREMNVRRIEVNEKIAETLLGQGKMEGFTKKVVDLYRKAGEANLYNNGWKPKNLVGRMFARAMSVRTAAAVTIGVVGFAAPAIGAVSMGTLALMRGVGGAVGTSDAWRSIERYVAEKKGPLQKKTAEGISTMDRGDIEQTMAEIESRCILDGIAIDASPYKEQYNLLVQGLTEKINAEKNALETAGTEQSAEQKQEALATFFKTQTRSAQDKFSTIMEAQTKKRNKRIAVSLAVGAVAAVLPQAVRAMFASDAVEVPVASSEPTLFKTPLELKPPILDGVPVQTVEVQPIPPTPVELASVPEVLNETYTVPKGGSFLRGAQALDDHLRDNPTLLDAIREQHPKWKGLSDERLLRNCRVEQAAAYGQTFDAQAQYFKANLQPGDTMRLTVDDSGYPRIRVDEAAKNQYSTTRVVPRGGAAVPKVNMEIGETAVAEEEVSTPQKPMTEFEKNRSAYTKVYNENTANNVFGYDAPPESAPSVFERLRASGSSSVGGPIDESEVVPESNGGVKNQLLTGRTILEDVITKHAETPVSQDGPSRVAYLQRSAAQAIADQYKIDPDEVQVEYIRETGTFQATLPDGRVVSATQVPKAVDLGSGAPPDFVIRVGEGKNALDALVTKISRGFEQDAMVARFAARTNMTAPELRSFIRNYVLETQRAHPDATRGQLLRGLRQALLRETTPSSRGAVGRGVEVALSDSPSTLSEQGVQIQEVGAMKEITFLDTAAQTHTVRLASSYTLTTTAVPGEIRIETPEGPITGTFSWEQAGDGLEKQAVFIAKSSLEETPYVYYITDDGRLTLSEATQEK